MDNGVFRGYVGFDECTVNRMWTQEQVDLLTFLAEVMAVFLVKKSNQERALRQAENLRSVLDRQDAWIYVIDPDSCELKFLNARAQNIAPEARPGMTCYRAFMGRDERCENCPAARIKEEHNAATLIRNDNLNVSARTRATLISWNGEDSCLLTCHDLSKE
jgi:putative two-component system response regulator